VREGKELEMSSFVQEERLCTLTTCLAEILKRKYGV
jgi:hypothetical protein